MVSFNLINQNEAEIIYQKLFSQNDQNLPSKRNWTHDEIKLLDFAVDHFCKTNNRTIESLITRDWKNISLWIPGRSETQWLYKWKKRSQGYIKQAFTKCTWTKQEDQMLEYIVAQNGPKNWQHIADILNQEVGMPVKRVGKQWRERWLNHLSPSISKESWTTQEDIILLENHSRLHNQWTKIAKYLSGRTETMVKNRYNALAKRKKKEMSMQNYVSGTNLHSDNEYQWRSDLINELKMMDNDRYLSSLFCDSIIDPI